MEDESMKKVEELAAWLKKHCHKYQRFYTDTYFPSDITGSASVAGVRLNISRHCGYVDILGLSADEQQALEMLMEDDDSLQDDEEDEA